jgi:hypothetical protein
LYLDDCCGKIPETVRRSVKNAVKGGVPLAEELLRRFWASASWQTGFYGVFGRRTKYKAGFHAVFGGKSGKSEIYCVKKRSPSCTTTFYRVKVRLSDGSPPFTPFWIDLRKDPNLSRHPAKARRKFPAFDWVMGDCPRNFPPGTRKIFA